MQSSFDLEDPIALDLGQIVLGPGRALRGRVRDAAGAPVEGATVSVGYRAYSLLDDAVRTNRLGAFLLPGVQEGAVPLTISHPAYRALEIVSRPGASDLEATLVSGVTLRLHVVDVDGSPLAGAEIWSVISQTRCTTDAEGRCTLSGIERKEQVLEYRLNGVARAPPRQIRVPVPALAAPITLRMPRRPAALRVTVVFPDGNPVEDALGQVRLIPGEIAPDAIAASTEELSWPYYASGYSTEKTFENLPPGRYTVVATVPDGRCAAPVIELGEEDRRLEVMLPVERGGCRR